MLLSMVVLLMQISCSVEECQKQHQRQVCEGVKKSEEEEDWRWFEGCLHFNMDSLSPSYIFKCICERQKVYVLARYVVYVIDFFHTF